MNTLEPAYPNKLKLSKIVRGQNPRRFFDPKKHEEMVVSIRLRGLIQPPLLRPTPGGADVFELVVGERRYNASLEAFGLEGEIPVIIRDMTDQEALEAAIAENDDRDDPSETEQADAAVRYLAACHGDRAEAARRLGWSRLKLDRRLTLAELAEPVKTALDERRIKIGHAELLAAVPADKQVKALETILDAGLDVAKTRELLMRVTQALAYACFDKTECTTCPFNSGTQRALFETHVDAGHCTNPTCFQLKTEAAETILFEEEERVAKAARAAATATVDPSDGDEQDGPDEEIDVDHADDADDTLPSADETIGPRASVPSIAATPAGSAPPAQKPTVTAESIARRTADLREATWRTALARALASNPSHAHITILVAAMSGTLSQIKADTLTSRAGLLVGATFPDLDYGAQIATIQGLPDRQAQIVLAVIGAAYAKDVVTFGHVADLAKAFEVDLRDSWKVDQAFLDRYTKEELKFIARECGLVAHMGQKAFAKRLAGKKSDLITSMLNAIGFDWSGRLPSAMTLDCTYGPPPGPAAPRDQLPVADLAA
ncbi:PRTRC system ParB family protein [Sphingomonas sp. H39-1-10]|uniref:PRTRC system ParB family protein n=1 Tax=Sphingomonas pollutisoli TaxID=3030829 RepID=UPI0023B98BBA|nr:PRTRC system ParB family protein [Sphingomonas pollutisoli]MDF0490246.1 PRTRC system ParB family protein [Sphingomonas pollutisoli]